MPDLYTLSALTAMAFASCGMAGNVAPRGQSRADCELAVQHVMLMRAEQRSYQVICGCLNALDILAPGGPVPVAPFPRRPSSSHSGRP